MLGSQIQHCLIQTSIEKSKIYKLQHNKFLTRGHLCETDECFKSNNNLKIGDQIQQGMSWPTAGQQKMW